MANRRKVRESGVSLLLGILSLMFIIPMVGLTIDVCILYTVRARLQSAVDGAALAAARALNLGQTTDSQAASAKQNAVNWFYANFPTGTWATTGANMTTASVNVFDDPTNSHLRNVTISASISAPTYFMQWFGYRAINIAASGNASRRDVVVMMVLDVSGSMQNAGVCDDMVAAAKIFTGQFAAGRDMIGLVTFNQATYIKSSPVTDFQTRLGYTNSSGSGTGILDTITCSGGTGTAQAISVGYNELYKVNLPGALNVLMFETDGLPNSLTVSQWDNTNRVTGISSSSNCLDINGKKVSQGGFATLAAQRVWAPAPSLGSGSYYTNLPSSVTASIWSADPSASHILMPANNYWEGDAYITTANGCAFNNNRGTYTGTGDFAWWPLTDIWGNELSPTNPYKSVTISGGHVQNSGWTNFHNAALNAADDAAHNARINATIPAYFFGIGLGGGTGDPPDLTLLQRMTNDPNPDTFSGTNAYRSCAQTTGCVNYPSEPQGTLVYSTNAAALGRAFLSISSQILRLSK